MKRFQSVDGKVAQIVQTTISIYLIEIGKAVKWHF